MSKSYGQATRQTAEAARFGVSWGRTSILCSVIVAAIVASLGCQMPEVCSRRHVVDAELAMRNGTGLGPVTAPGTSVIPETVTISDGVTADEAVTVALWNNAAFQESLAALGVSRAQLLAAGLLPDPQVQIFFPVGPKQFELTGYQAIDALWLRPIRERAAELDLMRVADQMVQNGLNVIRDVRVAHANLLMAQQQLVFAEETLELRREIDRLAGKRSDAGAISELEAAAPHIDALQAEADRTRAVGEVAIAQAQLLVLMGIQGSASEIVAVGLPLGSLQVPAAEEMLAEAFAVRPDLRAAELNVQAAQERLELAKCQWFTFDGILDMNSQGFEGYEAGPGTRFTIPIFNRNRGNIAIAEADLNTAQRQYVTVRDQIRNDVLTSHARLMQAARNLSDVQTKILPATQDASDLARKNYERGGTSYLLTLQTLGQYLTARGQEIVLAGDVRRALAELERSVGHQVECVGSVELDLPYLPSPEELAPLPAQDSISPQTTLRKLPACRPVSCQAPVPSGDCKP